METNNQNTLAQFSKYKSGLNQIRTEFEIINNEYEERNINNPIEHFKYRLKTFNSIEEKLRKKGLNLTIENIDNNLNDIIGIRIVCSFLSDVEEIINLIRQIYNKEDKRIIREKDYIQNPKESGYGSYHIQVEFPITTLKEENNYTTTIKAEIQIRTLAQDMWASLEHKMLYKKDRTIPSSSLKNLQEASRKLKTMDEILDIIIKNTKINIKKQTPSIHPILKTEEYIKLKKQNKLVLEQFLTQIKIMNEMDTTLTSIKPIEHIKSRVKSDTAIIEKLQRKNKAITIDNIKDYIDDVIGVRIVCSFKSDLEEIILGIQELVEYHHYKILKIRDYIKTPKENGYRSYHILIGIPLNPNNPTEITKIEVQIRTTAMDLYASLERKLYNIYVKESTTTPEKIKLENILKNMSKNIDNVDNDMDKIKKELNISKPKVRALIQKK